MNGGSSQSTTIAYNLPTGAPTDLGKAFLKKAYDLAITPIELYSTTHAVPYAPYQYIDSHYPEKEGIVALAARAGGNATVNKGKTYLGKVLDGDFLAGTDADFVEMVDDATGKPTTTFTNDIRPKLGASLYLVGDLSGENLANTLSSTLAARYSDRATASIKQANFQAERDKQHSATRSAIGYAEEPIRDAEALHRAGLRHRLWLHGYYKTKFELWQDETTEQYKQVEILGNAIGRLTNAVQTRTEPYHKPSPVSGMIGGAAAGAQVGGWWGAAAGAVIGYLASS